MKSKLAGFALELTSVLVVFKSVLKPKTAPETLPDSEPDSEPDSDDGHYLWLSTYCQ